MSIVDERGRLFGRINLIDLGLILFVAVLLPLGYGAYVLFRTPPATLTSVAPGTIEVGKKGIEQSVRVNGRHLRPFLRATLGKIDARAFLVETPVAGELRLVDVPPGTYDLTLYDEASEVAHLKNALTITAPPVPPIQLVGWFVGTTATSAQLGVGLKFGPAGHSDAAILGVREPEANRRRATLSVSCEPSARPCLVAGTAIESGKSLNLTVASQDGGFTFLVDEVRAGGLWTDVKVRFVGLPEVVALAHAGDVDRHFDSDTGAGTSPAILKGAVLLSLGEPQNANGSVNVIVNQGIPSTPETTVMTSANATLPMHVRTAEVRLPVEPAPLGWKYHDVPVRPGSVLTFETADYSVRGVMLSMSTPSVVSPPRGTK